MSIHYRKILSNNRRLEPLVDIENCGYKGSTTSFVMPSLFIWKKKRKRNQYIYTVFSKTTSIVSKMENEEGEEENKDIPNKETMKRKLEHFQNYDIDITRNIFIVG